MDASNFVRTGQRHRWAVAALFLMNGFLVGQLGAAYSRNS